MIERWLACAGVLSGLLVGGACDPRRPVDAGLDGGFDAGDGGSDAGRGDAGTDGGPDDPVWQTWLRLSDVCQIERATYPERLTPIEWRPCPDQPTGCLEQASGEGGTTTAYFDTARGRGYLVQSYDETHRRGPTIIALAPTEGPVLAAWRVPTYLARPTDWYCALSVELGAGDAVLMVTMENHLLSGQDRFEIYRAALEEIGDVSEPLSELYVRDPVLLEPRRIRVLSGRSTRGTLGGGWYAIGSGVINTTDGTLWSTGRRGSILYVSEQEMLLDGADGLIRIDPSTFTLAE